MKRQDGSGAWAVILAGGDGTRLQCLTTRIEGDARPKQFCRMLGDHSLLTQTRRRISPLFDADKTLAVVTEKHELYYLREFEGCPRTDLLVQPENRGTGVAIATAALMIRERDPDAIVAYFPCDHYYRDEAAFLEVVKAATATARANTDAIVLIGAEATYPEAEYGWIEPLHTPADDASFVAARVSHFWEKPTTATAQSLLERGCLWNTFLTVGSVSALIDVLSHAAPSTMHTLSAATTDNTLHSVYYAIPPLDFSRDVLGCHRDRLLVIRDAVSGWTDLGHPNRILGTLAKEGLVPAWLKSLRDATCV